MADYSYLKKLEWAGKPVRYALSQLEGEAELSLAPATEMNKPYFNALLKRNRKNTRAVQNRALTAALIQETREIEKELYAEHVIKGWTAVLDSSGIPVPFSKEEAFSFLTELPDFIFDELRAFASNHQNFTVDTIDVGEVSKNS